MLTNEPRLTKLAEAVADGATLDWPDDGSLTPEDREVLANLRALASIGQLFATASSSRRGSAFDAMPVLPDGAGWGNLRIIEAVGRGRFGQVYRAWDPALAREVALKLVPHREGDEGAESQVVEEGRLMARVRHPNVVTIHGAQRINGTSGLWMEFVDGRTLAAELEDRGPFEADKLIGVGIELCRALEAVHAAGLVHRDVKTQNVMRERGGRIVLGDFGTGRELDEESQAEGQGGLAGTPAYLAPEIFRRCPATPQSDLYSLGALLFHLATRRYPVEGRTLHALRDAHDRSARLLLRSLRPDLPDALCRVIERALSVDPEQRFGDAAGMAAALETCRQSPAHPQRRWLVAAASVALLATASTAVWWTGRPRPAAIPFGARDWVLVTAVENRSGDPLLDGTLQYALERELAQSSFVNVASRDRVLDTLRLMQKPPDTVLDETTSREVALRDGEIRSLVAARVDKVGGKYSMSARIVSPADGRVVAVVDEPAVAQDAVLDSLARLSLGVRTRLGEVSLHAQKSSTVLPKVSTSSLRALQLYAQARALQQQGTSAVATAAGFNGKEKTAELLLKQAVKEDSNFASAFHLLSIAVRLDGMRSQTPRHDEAIAYAQRAVDLADFASPIERIRHEGELHAARWFARQTGPENRTHLARAVASCEALLQLDPNDVDALIGCSGLYGLIDRPHAAFATRLADLRPNSPRWQLRAARALLASMPPRRDEAQRYINRAEKLPFTDDSNVYFELGKVRFFDAEQAWLNKDARTAARLVDRIFADSRSLPQRGAYEFAAGAARAYLTLGQLTRAESLVVHAAPVAQPNLLATVRVDREDRVGLREALRGRKVEDMTGITSVLIEAGMFEEARQALELLRTRPLMTTDYLLMAEGQLALGEKRYEDATRAFEQQLQQTPPGESVMRQWRALAKLGAAYLAIGELQKGIARLEAAPPPDAVTSQGLGWGFEWLLMRERLAQLYRAAGRLADAQKVEAELLQLLAVADEDHPIKRRLAERARQQVQ